jgi:Stress responsive A/B Barrel Domain
MLAHVVLFRPKAGLSDPDRDALIDAFRKAVEAIPSIRRARIGQRVTHGRPYERLMRSDYAYLALLEFDDLAGLQAYLNHPAHEQLATTFFAAFEEALMYDYELNEGSDAAAIRRA